MTTTESSGQISHQGRIELDQPTELAFGEAVRVKIWRLSAGEAVDPSANPVESDGRINHEGQIELEEQTDLQPGEMVRVRIETLYELPYDDDHEWNSVLTLSLDTL